MRIPVQNILKCYSGAYVRTQLGTLGSIPKEKRVETTVGGTD